ncbi:hypothetical protein HOY80DRAFT_32312 [Tuber brumale]|nr:hypothetical protein HOY80DRAFT_32312 [Tuber brumale]
MLIGTAYSVLIRLELSGPGVQFIADNQLYNSIITSHAILMIFFMVNNMLMLNISPVLSVKTHNTAAAKIGFVNNKKDPFNSKHSYTKIEVKDPSNNRDIILKIAKKQKGVFFWETLDEQNLYVGHSINLYNRISSYFMPSILKTKARRVLRYFNKHGFTNIKLTIYIMDNSVSLEQVVELEQHFIDSLKPNLNVDLVASSSPSRLRTSYLGWPIFEPKPTKFLYYIPSKINRKGLHTGKNPVVPVIIYQDAELEKNQIMLDNKGKAGIYR